MCVYMPVWIMWYSNTNCNMFVKGRIDKTRNAEGENGWTLTRGWGEGREGIPTTLYQAEFRIHTTTHMRRGSKAFLELMRWVCAAAHASIDPGNQKAMMCTTGTNRRSSSPGPHSPFFFWVGWFLFPANPLSTRSTSQESNPLSCRSQRLQVLNVATARDILAFFPSRRFLPFSLFQR